MINKYLVIILLVVLVPSIFWIFNQIQIHSISGTGTVIFVDIEGGFYGIISDDGKQYDPLNLGQAYQRDGLRIRFTAKINEVQASIHQWGIIIEIIEIEEIS